MAAFMFLIAERHAQAIEYLFRVAGKVDAQDLLLHAVAGICLHGGIPIMRKIARHGLLGTPQHFVHDTVVHGERPAPAGTLAGSMPNSA